MKKVLSFSLWGNKPHYNIGSIKNVELAKIFYPDYECWIYIHKESVPNSTIEKLQNYDNVKIIFKNGDLNIIKPMMWRFEAIDDPEVEIMLSRDTDTRILLREKLAVDEWLSENKLFHIMRDHPHHNFTILGGMFGTKKNPQIDSWKNLMENIKQIGVRDYDQTFLNNIIYPIIKNNSTIHATFHMYEPHAKKFPIDYDKYYNFVGGYVYENENRSNEHLMILKRSLK